MRLRWFVIVAWSGMGLSGTGAALSIAEWAPAWHQPLAWSGVALAAVSIGGVACDMLRLQREIREIQAQNEALAIQSGRWLGCPWLYQRDRRSWLLKRLGVATPKPSQRRWMAMSDAEREAYYQDFMARVEACRHQLDASRPWPAAPEPPPRCAECQDWYRLLRDQGHLAPGVCPQGGVCPPAGATPAEPDGMTIAEYAAWHARRRDRSNAAWLMETLEGDTDGRDATPGLDGHD